ncbi:MAG: DUF1800 family protein [Deltaproteobacteria bacterium]|nr:DUF1800 family protein [Deltaproteobacteria bacterium]
MSSGRQGWSQLCGARRWLALLVILCAAAPTFGAATPTPVGTVDMVTVQVVNAISGQPLAALPIQAKRRSGDVFTWVASATTDATGRATVKLTGVSQGVRFAIFATPYNGGSVRSDDVAAPGAFTFRVGKLPVSVVAGGSNAPLANTKVTLKQKLSDGTLKSLASGTTTAQGLIIFDPLGLGAGNVYLLEALSPWDGSTQRSNEIRDPGGVTFVVGNAPLAATVMDGLSNAPLANLVVNAYERGLDGKLTYVRQRTTSSVGRAVFDLPGLGSGRTYVLRTTAFNGMSADSEDLVAAGELAFKVGTLKVAVVAGGTNKPLAATKVDAYERRADGSLAWSKGGSTDSSGIIRFDLPGLGRGRTYVLKAKSPADGTTKSSNEITQTGAMTFVVGNAPLTVTAVDAISGAPIAGLGFSAVERLADGTTKDYAWRTTDSAGKAVLDLPGLGSGRTYFLASWPFGTGKAVSEDLTAPGAYTYKLGKLKVAVVNGADGTPLANVDAWASEKRSDGTFKWAAGGKTDAAGVIRFDLPGLGAGKLYVIEARSPWDGSGKRSDDVTRNGSMTFAVGRAPLRVRVSNALSGDPLVGLKVTANRRDGSSLAWVAQQTTDASGKAVFDLDGLGAGATFVLSASPYGSTVYSDDIREAGVFELRVGTVELTVLNGASGAPLVGTKVTALSKNADGSWAWSKQATTDERGIIRFDLPGLGRGATYVFEAKSPADGSTKRSQPITAVGAVVFKVGNTPLVVTLQDGVGGQLLAGIGITVNEKLASGEQRWVAQRTTDAAGQAVFDLDGLGSGRTYVLYASVYNGGTSWSDDLTQPGPYTFRVGTLQVRTLSGASGAPLAAYKVSAYEVASDGTLKWAAGGTTDAAGVIRFDLLGLRAGRVYRLQAKSPIDGSTKYSPDVTREGALDFVVGSAPLRVTLVNGVSGAALPAIKITAREVLVDGTTTWARELTTDASGIAAFDLDGLGSGRRYSLYAKPYGNGVSSDPLMAPGDVFFRVGTVPVTLIDAATNLPLANRKLIAERKLDDGTRVWTADGTTDANGVVAFDLPGLSQTVTTQQPPAPRLGERVYVIRAYDPFGNGKKYYSGLVSQEGPVLMRVDQNVAAPPDFTAPRIAILNPQSGASVDAEGFTLLGEASDNVSIASVTGTLSDPVKGVTTLAVAYNPTLRQWTASVPSSALSAGQTCTVTVTALDQAQNRASATASFTATADAAPPQVSILSPGPGSSVPRSGFLVSGLATDDIGVTSLVATVDDARLGRTVTQTLGVGANGGWSFAVLSGQVSEGQTATVTVTARDAKNNQAAASVSLTIVGVDFLAHHLLNRITFGSTPELLFEVQRVGVDAFIDQQLNPAAIDDSQLAALLPAAPASKAELQRQTLLRMIYSRRQLLEVMTWFWDNHFNTDVNKTNNTVAFEAAENAQFRANALGRFRDLLAVSAKSPAMLYYLDQAASRRDQPNENYPRELMELHTLSVDGGYTQTDVEQVARAFTGWTVVNGQFAFDPANHDTGAKVVLGQTLPAGRGIEDGEQVLDILAAHPSTANFICTKLAQVLVGDAPSPLLVGRCASEYLNTQGSIAAVVRIILRSPEFAAPAAFRGKVRTPVEMAVFWARALGANSDAAGLPAAISDMGLRLYENPVPTGWSETGDDWINSNTLLQRFKYANRLVRNQLSGTSVDLRGYFTRNRQTTADGIVGFLLQQLFYGEFTPLEYDTAIGVLTDDGTRPFFITQADAEARLQQMVGTVLTYPGGQYQ